MKESEAPSWEPARLIPVSGIRSAEEQEHRATSALLAVLSAVDEFGFAFAKPFGAPKGKLETYIEVTFDLADGRAVRPDGLIRVTYGKRIWTALVEVKTGNNSLLREQTEAYLDLAKEQGFNCVITISNQVARIPGQHPVEVDKKKTNKVSLYHLSWSRVVTEAVLQKRHRGVRDRDQAWILNELIRYLEDEKAGAVDFCDMGQHWVSVRDAVRVGTLSRPDKKAFEIAGKWEELISFAVLRLGRELGANVQEVMSSKERRDPAIRIKNIVDAMVKQGVMAGVIRIPDTVSDIKLNADLRARQIVISVALKAPEKGKSLTRINWLLRQLKSSPPDVKLDSWGKHSRSSMCEKLEEVRTNPSLLIPTGKRELTWFTVSLTRDMGFKRTKGKKSFISSVLDALDEFYGEVVQNLREWQPPAPKLQRVEEEEPDTDPNTTAVNGSLNSSENATITEDSPSVKSALGESLATDRKKVASPQAAEDVTRVDRQS